jgi:O-antigen ligase
MLAGVFATLSRGGFLALVAMMIVLTVRLLRRNRATVLALILVGGIAFVLLAPGGYGHRLFSILDPSQDVVGSATARRDLLFRSIGTALRRPLLGVGIGNFQEVSIRNQVSHNSYTQIAAEIGLPALVVYVLFLITVYKRLRRIEHETVANPACSYYYYLSIGLQASLAGYLVGSFFLSVAFEWFIYFLVGYAIYLSRAYEANAGPSRQKESAQEVSLASPISAAIAH